MSDADTLALTLALPAEDHLVRDGDWADRLEANATGIDGRTIAARLAGAALDVFDQKPLPRDNPLVTVPQVVLSSPPIGCTASMRASVMAEACGAVLAYATGRVPSVLANPAVLQHPRAQWHLGPAAQNGQI